MWLQKFLRDRARPGAFHVRDYTHVCRVRLHELFRVRPSHAPPSCTVFAKSHGCDHGRPARGRASRRLSWRKAFIGPLGITWSSAHVMNTRSLHKRVRASYGCRCLNVYLRESTTHVRYNISCSRETIKIALRTIVERNRPLILIFWGEPQFLC